MAAEGTSEQAVGLVAKPNTTSSVWTDLSRTIRGKVKNEERAVCRLCSKKVATKARNTSNLYSHLRNHHSAEYNVVKEVRAPSKTPPPLSTQPTITDAVTLATKYTRNSKRWKELTDAVAFCITKDMLPIYTVEKPGFKQLLTKFDSRYQLPSRNYFSRTAIPGLYT